MKRLRGICKDCLCASLAENGEFYCEVKGKMKAPRKSCGDRIELVGHIKPNGEVWKIPR